MGDAYTSNASTERDRDRDREIQRERGGDETPEKLRGAGLERDGK